MFLPANRAVRGGINHLHLSAQSRRLQDKAQAPRHRYRSGIGQRAEGDETALCFRSVAQCARSVAATASRLRAS